MHNSKNLRNPRGLRGRIAAVGLIAGLAAGLVPATTAQAGFGDGMSIGDGSDTPRNRARTQPLRNELASQINARREAAGQDPLEGGALADAAEDALEALRCHIMLLGDLANCQIKDEFGDDAGDTWDEMLEDGRVCVIAGANYRGACRTDGVTDDEGDRININLNILPFDQKYDDLCDLLLAQPSVSSSALTLFEEIHHAQQDWDWPEDGDLSVEGRVRQRLRSVCNEQDVDDLQLEATCDALDAIENLENGDPHGATTEFGSKIAECLDDVEDDPATKDVDERQEALDAVKNGLLDRKTFTGGVGDVNENGEIDKGEDLNGDGAFDRPGTRACYNAGKQAYQAWLGSPMDPSDLDDLNDALADIRWATAIPGQLGLVVDPGAPIPRGDEPAQLFYSAGSGSISQFLASDSVDHMLHTPLESGVLGMVIFSIGPGLPNAMMVGGSIAPGIGGLFMYGDLDDNGIFEQETEIVVMVDPLPGADLVGLVLPPGAPLTELLVVMQNNPLFHPNDDIQPFSVIDTNFDGLPDQLGFPVSPPLLDPLDPQFYGPIPTGAPQQLLAGPEQADGTVSDRDAMLLTTPTGVQQVYLDQVQMFPPYPIGLPLPGQTFVTIGAPPLTNVEMYFVDPTGAVPSFDEFGVPLIPPISVGTANDGSVAFIDVPPLAFGEMLVARVAQTGALSVDIPVGGCNPADLAPPFGVLDLADINQFAAAFLGGNPLADLTGDGLLDLQDINLFVSSFLGGCPS